MRTKLNERSKWLLKHTVSKLPYGVASIHPFPCDAPVGVGMSTMRGLQKRGFVKESTNGWVFFATERGGKALEEIDNV